MTDPVKYQDLACDLCGAYKGHAPLCNANTHVQTLEHLRTYYEAFQRHHKEFQRDQNRMLEGVAKADQRAALWHGKWAIVKQENNALRKKLPFRPKEKPNAAS